MVRGERTLGLYSFVLVNSRTRLPSFSVSFHLDGSVNSKSLMAASFSKSCEYSSL